MRPARGAVVGMELKVPGLGQGGCWAGRSPHHLYGPDPMNTFLSSAPWRHSDL